jgi:hypothetical protein
MKIKFDFENNEDKEKKESENLNKKLKTKKISTKKVGEVKKEGKDLVIKISTKKKFDAGN